MSKVVSRGQVLQVAARVKTQVNGGRVIANVATSALILLRELIKVRVFSWVNHDITDERFPTPNRLWNSYKEFHFGENISSEEAIRRMQAEGYEPANSHELLCWDGWNGKDAVIALGSITKVTGNRHALVLFLSGGGSRGGQYLSLAWWGSRWRVHYRFLGVRKDKIIK